jgi:hypothetical protein
VALPMLTRLAGTDGLNGSNTRAKFADVSADCSELMGEAR